MSNSSSPAGLPIGMVIHQAESTLTSNSVNRANLKANQLKKFEFFYPLELKKQQHTRRSIQLRSRCLLPLHSGTSNWSSAASGSLKLHNGEVKSHREM